ncbi:MAG: hypothetical protein M1822_008498 [Bathelium mastoideum]|nr:MAG: hypothetical protein M1822_008498 [Bathelium mastoideum]
MYGHSRDFNKSSSYHIMVHQAPSTFTATDRTLHVEKRKLLSRGFSASALQDHGDNILKHVRKLADQIAPNASNPSEWSVARDMAKWTSYLVIDVLLDVVFGLDYNLINKPDNRAIVKSIEDCNIRTGVLFQARELKTRFIDKYLFSASIASRKKLIHFVKSLLDKRIKPSTMKRNDVFSNFLVDENPDLKRDLSMAELGSEATTLLMAGSETTSTAIAAALFYLIRSPKAYEKAVKEIQQHFPNIEDVCLGQELSSCVYLRACVDESLRMSPPAASAQWREVMADGVRVDEQPVPAGCDVGTSLYAIHHRPDYFPDPFAFRPERWFIDSASENKESVQLQKSAFAPFLLGPRSCIAKELAISETMLTLATLLGRFEVRAADGLSGKVGCGGRKNSVYGRHRTEEYQLWEHVAAVKQGPIVQFRERKG